MLSNGVKSDVLAVIMFLTMKRMRAERQKFYFSKY